MRPILAVDVDGVLNAVNSGAPAIGWHDTKVQGFRIRYNPDHGAQLLEIARETGAELTWCTTWEEMANTYIRHLVGLPELPVIPMEPFGWREALSVGNAKAAAIAHYAGERPFCWLDDEPDAIRALRNHPVPHLVVHVRSYAGLQDHHLARARGWLLDLKGHHGPATPA